MDIADQDNIRVGRRFEFRDARLIARVRLTSSSTWTTVGIEDEIEGNGWVCCDAIKES